MRAAVARPLSPPDAATPTDPACRFLCAEAPAGEGRHDRAGTPFPRIWPNHHPAAASVLADDGMGTPQPLVRRRPAARPAAGHNDSAGGMRPGMVELRSTKTPGKPKAG